MNYINLWSYKIKSGVMKYWRLRGNMRIVTTSLLKLFRGWFHLWNVLQVTTKAVICYVSRLLFYVKLLSSFLVSFPALSSLLLLFVLAVSVIRREWKEGIMRQAWHRGCRTIREPRAPSSSSQQQLLRTTSVLITVTSARHTGVWS